MVLFLWSELSSVHSCCSEKTLVSTIRVFYQYWRNAVVTDSLESMSLWLSFRVKLTTLHIFWTYVDSSETVAPGCAVSADHLFINSGALQWEGLKKTGSFPHLDRWYNHIGSIPALRDIQEKYYPKRNNVRKRQIADTIKEKKADPKTASARHTG